MSRTKSSPLKKSKSLRMQTSFGEKTNAANDSEKPAPSQRKVTDLNEFFKLSKECSNHHHHPTANEVVEEGDSTESADGGHRDEGLEVSTGKSMSIHYNRLPPPALFGDGNPFLMFMCIACVLQHRDYIIEQQLDYQVLYREGG